MVFQKDVEAAFERIKERSKYLKEKESNLTPENSNLQPKEAEAFASFPKHFQQALISNDIQKVNESFAMMSKEEADAVMKKCQESGLIQVLSEEEAAKYVEENPEEAEAAVQADPERGFYCAPETD